MGHLAFDQRELADQATIGILAASLLVTLLGFVILTIVGGRSPVDEREADRSAR